MLATFAKAMLLGFSVAAPVGPIGILCIRRTIADGRTVGLACGLGAATADALYGLVAGLGVTVLIAALTSHAALIRIGGALYLAYLGIATFRSRPAQRPVEAAARSGCLGGWASTFVLTITNPMTIISFVAMFSAITVGDALSRWQAPVLAAGVFVGSAVWWLSLTGVVSLLRSRVRSVHLLWINRGGGLALLGFAIASLASLLHRA